MAIEQKINYQPFQTAGLKALRAPQRAQSQFRTLAKTKKTSSNTKFS